MSVSVDGVKITRTRFDGSEAVQGAHLGVMEQGARLWRVVDLSEAGRASAVGPFYATKAEALADLSDYVRRAGWIKEAA